MVHLLLVIIYLAFISLGLPDSILGSAWPSMYQELGVSISYAGIISMLISAGTILSSLFSAKLIKKLGTGIVTTASVALTAVALFGFSFSSTFWQLCFCTIPYGLGAGCVDAALNNFVSLHYKVRHMNWLHCFWGIGATAGPYIMGLCLTNGFRWNTGYFIIAFIQVALILCLFLSLPLWKQKKEEAFVQTTKPSELRFKGALKLPGAKAAFTAFFCYCALENTAGLWAGSYLVLVKGIDTETAATWAAFFYFGITIGRFFCGFIPDHFSDKYRIRTGQGLILFGVLLLILPFLGVFSFVGLLLIGIGCAPVFPSLIHETPKNFGSENSQMLMGMQMACAYVGTSLIPPFFGFLSEKTSIQFYPYFLCTLLIFLFFMVEKLNRQTRKDDK